MLFAVFVPPRDQGRVIKVEILSRTALHALALVPYRYRYLDVLRNDPGVTLAECTSR